MMRSHAYMNGSTKVEHHIHEWSVAQKVVVVVVVVGRGEET
jgi:hypothetical protein